MIQPLRLLDFFTASGLLGDLSGLLRTTETHFHPLCCTQWYMNYSVTHTNYGY
jgi:hypothetical protein